MDLQRTAADMGLRRSAERPLVRSSYRAGRLYRQAADRVTATDRQALSDRASATCRLRAARDRTLRDRCGLLPASASSRRRTSVTSAASTPLGSLPNDFCSLAMGI